MQTIYVEPHYQSPWATWQSLARHAPPAVDGKADIVHQTACLLSPTEKANKDTPKGDKRASQQAKQLAKGPPQSHITGYFYGYHKVVEYGMQGVGRCGRSARPISKSTGRAPSNPVLHWASGLGSVAGVVADGLRLWLSVLQVQQGMYLKAVAEQYDLNDPAQAAIAANLKSYANDRIGWASARFVGGAAAGVADGTSTARYCLGVALSATAMTVGASFGLAGDVISSAQSVRDAVRCYKRFHRSMNAVKNARSMRNALRAQGGNGNDNQIRFLNDVITGCIQHSRRQLIELVVHVVKAIGRFLTMTFAAAILCGGPVSWAVFAVGAGFYVMAQMAGIRLKSRKRKHRTKQRAIHTWEPWLQDQLKCEGTSGDTAKMLRKLGIQPEQLLVDTSHWVLAQALLPS